MFGNIYERTKDNWNPGLIFLIVKDLLTKIKQPKFSDIKFDVKLSYLEIYNETVKDLLNTKNNDNLLIIEDPDKGIVVPDLKEYDIGTAE